MPYNKVVIIIITSLYSKIYFKSYTHTITIYFYVCN